MQLTDVDLKNTNPGAYYYARFFPDNENSDGDDSNSGVIDEADDEDEDDYGTSTSKEMSYPTITNSNSTRCKREINTSSDSDSEDPLAFKGFLKRPRVASPQVNPVGRSDGVASHISSAETNLSASPVDLGDAVTQTLSTNHDANHSTPPSDLDEVAGKVASTDPRLGTSAVEKPESHDSDFHEMEEPAKTCMLKELLDNTPSDLNRTLSSLRSATLCSECVLCKIMRKVRIRPPEGDETTVPLEKGRAKALQFWSRVDMCANNLFWVASQVEYDTDYTLTRMLHKDAVLDHPYMRKPNGKVEFKDFRTMYGLFSKLGKISNAIQGEELNLARALICLGTHYGALSLDSKARSKLEALDMIDNVSKSLRILWEAELKCRKLVLKDNE